MNANAIEYTNACERTRVFVCEVLGRNGTLPDDTVINAVVAKIVKALPPYE